MFVNHFNSENRKFRLYVQITCKGEKNFRVWAQDNTKPNSKYADREITVNGKRTIYLSFPISPKKLLVGVCNCQDVKDKDFEVLLMEDKLPTYNIFIDKETDNFLKLALHFSQVCGFEKADNTGRIFKTDDDMFKIKYFDIIRDYMSGQVLNTPARIGHNSGIIEVAKNKFDNYTIPMRLVILLHEYSHKYRNPKIGLDISNEVGADINALYFYLGLGFSKIDAICVFAKVFLKAQTQGNINRMRKIMEYIQKFENQQFAELN
jgi:hypothetical protein